MIRKVAGLVAVLIVTLAAWVPADAAGPVIVSGPGSYYTTYTQPVTAAQPGGELTYVNLDVSAHNVVSDAKGPDSAPWCDPNGPDLPGRQYELGRCPLFWTPLIGLSETTPVYGLERIVSGNVYKFKCEPHGWMEGYLVALPSY